MSATFSGSPAKATFQALEGENQAPFQVQYNPKDLQVDRTVTWGEHEESGQGQGALEFQKGESLAVTMELVFDTTNESAVKDVRTAWVNGLLAMTNPQVQAESGEQEEEGEKLRPPKILFSWGSFELTCVIESIRTQYLLFAGDGTPLRAKCTVQLKEWTETSFDEATGGGRWAGNAIQLVEAKAGSLPANVAWKARTPWRNIARDNNVDDPMEEFTPGTEVVVRKK